MTLAAGPIYIDRKEEEAFRDAIAIASVDLFPPQKLDDVFEYYGLRGGNELQVLDYLTRYRDLVSILLDAQPRIADIFGEVNTYLEIDEDPEGGFEELFGVISVDASPEDAIRRLDRFDDLWFSRVARATDGRLNFTVDTRDVESL